jgi:hypothetical protein
MIKFSNQVPSVYSNASRDFQYLGWLIDIVLNSVKHNVNGIYDLPNSTDPRLTELLAMTLGFKVKRNYDQDQLRALVAALPRILKYKGTIAAVEMAGRALIAASGSTGAFSCKVKNCELIVELPATLVDVSLFTDLLTYILPAGMTFRIERASQRTRKIETNVLYGQQLIAELVPDVAFDHSTNTTTGLSNIFNAGITDPVFANFTGETSTEGFPVNTEGLMDNTIIPALLEPMSKAKQSEEK